MAIEENFPQEWGSIAAFAYVRISDAEAATIDRAFIRRRRYKVRRAAFTPEELQAIGKLNGIHNSRRAKWAKAARGLIKRFRKYKGRVPSMNEQIEIERDVEAEDIQNAIQEVVENALPDSILEERVLGNKLVETPEDTWLPEPEGPDLEPPGE